MILDKIANFKRYSAVLPEVLEYIENVDYKQLSNGKHTLNEDSFVLVNEYSSKQQDKYIFENHHAYVDVHFVISGSEKINFINIEKLEMIQSYDNENDYELLEGNGQNESFVINEGSFCVFYPGEAHQPGIAAYDEISEIKKIVFKIKIKEYDK